MLTAEENETFTRVGPGTPMGRLMRWYWHPIAASSQLDENPVMPVTLLGESLVLYRDRSGTVGLVDNACAHRRVNLVFGIPEEEGLRCPYHGWRYDETGQCLEMPAEPADTTFPGRVKITAYPVEELAGLVFAYLGPQPAPLLPRWDLFVYDNVVRDIGLQVLPCNWLQMQENDTDPAHLAWLHGRFANYALERLGRPDLQRSMGGNFVGSITEKRNWQPYEQGIMNFDKRGGAQEWQPVRPMIFPNMNSFSTELMYRVPVDDTHTLHVFYASYPQEPGAQKQEKVPYFTIPASVDENRMPIWGELDNNGGQDSMAWIAQGDIVDRTKEKLAESDRGILVFREMLRRQLRVVEDGGEPMNVFRDPAANERIDIPPRSGAPEWAGPEQVLRGRATGQYKHSPIMKEMVEKYRGKKALTGPVR
jgi:5,5'-dehydrodivanillate O-demethylase oxygenase subunit